VVIRSRAKKVTEWQERLARFHRSGTSITQFCHDEGVSTPSFYVWRRKLRRRPVAAGSSGAGRLTAGSAVAGQGVQRQTVQGQPRQGSFVPVRVLSDMNFDGQLTMIAELRGGTRLTIPLAGPETLQLAIAALVGADAERAGDRPC
jgi:transposase-like protein